ncbi:MAG: N-acyl-D-amino-acid deacylase family protein [Armatimonadota bacterium]
MLDILIKNGFIVDGSGQSGYHAEIGIQGDRIAEIGELNSPAKRILDAEGLVISPGFIDIHSHTDHLVYVNQTCESKVTQGVTTEVSGNCGESAAPRGGLHCCEDLCDWGPDHGVVPTWSTMGEYLAKLDNLPKTINSATFVGHGTIRGIAMGYEDRKPTPDELAEMKRLVSESLEDGAFGISSGLVYPPGCYAETDELIELCRVAAEYNGIYSTHIRNENIYMIDAVDEAIRIGRESGASVQISHHKACGNRSKGKVKESLAMIDAARAEGLDIWADQYPYLASCTGLSSILPKWTHDGGTQALIQRLTDSDIRGKIKDELIASANPGEMIADTGGWESIVVNAVYTHNNRFFEGKSIAEIAVMMNKHPVDVVIDLLISEGGNVGIIHFMIDEDDVRTVMKHPNVLIGSDATTRSLTGRLSTGKPHPRAYGTFPMILRRYVREEKLLSLEEAVAKMTGRVAHRMGFIKRGFIKEGFFADITIFNPDTISDASTYENPGSYANGISYVLVNGQIVIDEGSLLNIKQCSPGRVIRRGTN